MSDILFSTLIIITIILVIASVVLSIMAYRAAKEKCNTTNESATYSTYSAVVAGVSVLMIGIAFLLYFSSPDKCPVAPKDNTKELVAQATAALQKHANELKVHAEVLNDAFGKVNNISNDLSATCKDAGSICQKCPAQAQPVAQQFGAQPFGFGRQKMGQTPINVGVSKQPAINLSS